jgi:hypothetical protein
MPHGKPILSEQEIKRQVTDWLTQKRYFWWPNNTGAFKASYGGKPRFVRFGKPGSPDLFVMRKGITFGLELKSEKGFQSQVQKQFEVEFTEAGGKYLLCYSLQDVISGLRIGT